jgi:EpsI family protein
MQVFHNVVTRMTTLKTTAIVMAGLMVAASVGSIAARPAPRDPNLPPAIVLEQAVPKRFGDWTEAPQRGAQVVNPQTQELLDKLYSQTLTRTYVNSKGYAVMLSMAYGDDQRGGLQAHMPEVCYPAQGFKVNHIETAAIETPFGAISGKRLNTSMGSRIEPITYWFAMGDTAVKTRWEKRLVEVRLGLTGQVPDGLLFRISSIDPNAQQAYAAHQAFVADLLAATPEKDRRKLSGL